MTPDLLGQARLFFENFTAVPPLEWLHAARLFSVLRLKKSEHFFEQGVSSDRMGVLVKGLMQAYYHDPEGNLKVKRFIGAGKPVGPYPEIVYGRMPSYGLQAIEESVILTLPYADFARLQQRHVCWERVSRKALELEIVERESKEYELFMLSAPDRYDAFLARHRELIDRIPQYLIASYIGITPVALSRIRATRNPSVAPVSIPGFTEV